MVGLANKALDEVGDAEAEKGRYALRREFWAKLIKRMNSVSGLYTAVAPTKQSWIGTSSGVRGLSLNFVATQSFGRVELYIDRANKVVNEDIYNELWKQKDSIEKIFGQALMWQLLETKRACRIKFEFEANVFDRERWGEMIELLSESMIKLDKALKQVVDNVGFKINPGEFNGLGTSTDLQENVSPEEA